MLKVKKHIWEHIGKDIFLNIYWCTACGVIGHSFLNMFAPPDSIEPVRYPTDHTGCNWE